MLCSGDIMWLKMVRQVPRRAATALRLRQSDPGRSQTVTLVDVINEAERPGSDLVTPFEALLSGALVGRREPPTVRPVRVLAVLERTAVVCPAGSTMPAAGDRALARLAKLLADRAVILWNASGQKLRFGFDGKVSPPGRRRCPRCGRTEGQTEFRAHRTSYCIPCTREASHEYRQRQARGVEKAA